MLKGKKGLVLGISNDNSIAWACARAMHEAGATLGGTWLNDKARPYVEPLLQSVNAEIQLPLEVSNESQLEALFEEVTQRWGKLDFLLHSIAFAPKADLHGRVVDSSLEGFLQAMDISCHSFIRMARLAEPLMKDGGSLMTMSYLGGQEVVPNYGIMGPVKAALESTVRYLAYELGEQGIRVNVISPGTIMTRAASGIASFDALVEENAQRAPMGAVDIDDVGPLSVFLASDGSRAITGGNVYVDGGFNILN
ncbi:Enoyl-[acyl-carrier-protein] reductase [NADH] FabI [Oligella ureolytica]|uniref:Enoyl-[acyl-carrier-protein] reductase [NADH] n=1 Tax=Oligella ureolytica TaxID=90244 RepID=A0A378XEI7_9BURK|nr:enoyl-ACP reductase FabI [Oligella ureolytica]QPT41202.1 enoyl-ACP reductase FabI [Oligella ureolytica]SUA54073.1 Enoyl-[acyl-carrier-protein] reductase [NADH] FabI [Oligella ureolytica]SUA55183.1 Enoyl-[acyl-carrier-protein] reductase [NADH] FabI [Oligella ureolytica]